MAEYSLLKNAPITEALIDIRARIKEDFDVNRFLSLYDAIIGQYPEKKTRHKWEAQFEFKKGDAPISSGKETVDGFTFNRLKPYDKWETFRDEALRLWQLYRELVSPDIVRVALRYINKFDIPLFPHHMGDFNEYLTAAPIVPEGLPQGVSSFLTRVVINDPETEAAAIITQAFEQIIDPKFLPIIFDIDVFKQKEVISEEEAWQTLEKLRHFKNKIFFESITEKAKELFQ